MKSPVLSRWRDLCRASPQATALIEAAGPARVSRRELDERAEAWAARHAPDGLARQIVVFSAPNGALWFELFLGILKAGGVAVALDPAEPAAAQQAIARALRAAARWEQGGLVGSGKGRRFVDPDICLIKLTSGSTGRPRPLVFTSRQMLADAQSIGRTMGLRLRDLNYGLIPLGHSYGLGNLTFPLLGLGIPLVCGSSALPHAIGADFAAHRPSVFPGVPAIFRGLALSEGVALPGLRLAISAGAPLPRETAAAFQARFGVGVHGFYGSSETGGIAYDTTGAETLAGTGTGRPLDRVRVRAVAGRRILVAGPAVVTFGNRRRVRALGAWIPADRACFTPTGSLQVLGRRDQTVKIAGRRLGLQEVVGLLRGLPGVRDAWAGISTGADPQLGAAVATERSVASLREALAPLCPLWKIPKRWVVLANLPLSARGKIDQAAIRARVFPAAEKS